jgi:hypothetical protein
MDRRAKSFPENRAIQNFMDTYNIKISWSRAGIIDIELVPMELKIGDKTYTVHVIDEYNDLNYYNQLLNFVLVFRELELINDSTDYLDWCKQQALKVNNDALSNYYTDTINLIPEISDYFANKEITSFIQDLDFQLNSGAIQYLRI